MIGPSTALLNARVFDGRQLSRPRTVTIREGVVTAEEPGSTEVDLDGAALLPGFIDSHVHLRQPRDLVTLARWGITTALDMGCWPPDRVVSLKAATGPRADFRSAGLPAIGPDGPHAHMPDMSHHAVVLTADHARSHVAEQIAHGAHYVKAVAEAPGQGGPSPTVLAALVAAAREHGVPTVIHAASVGAFTAAVQCGAQFVTHAPVVGHIRPEDIRELAETRRTAIPTTVMMAGIIDDHHLAGGRGPVGPLASVAALHRAGVTILAGTDANATPGAPTRIEHGRSLHDELELLVRAGLSNAEALRSATSLPAAAFGLTDRGSIRPGMRADLVAVDGDPTRHISATRSIRAVWAAGRPVTPAGPTEVNR